MKYKILAVDLKDNVMFYCREHFAERNIALKSARNISEAVHILGKETVALDLEICDVADPYLIRYLYTGNHEATISGGTAGKTQPH